MDLEELLNYYKSIPPITRIFITCFFITSVFIVFFNHNKQLGIVQYFSLYLDIHLIFFRFQIWRLLTCFFFVGDFSIFLLFNMIILFYILLTLSFRYSSQLENSQYAGQTADFAFLYIFCMTVLAILGATFNIPFLSQSLIETIIYIWSRKNPHALISLFGLITIPAPWFPYVSLTFTLIIGHDIKVDLIGLLAGHLYFYLEDVYPARHNGVSIIKTPQFIKNIVEYFSNLPPQDQTNNFHAGGQWQE